ncbi:MAG: ABC transporter permease [Planctomycetes bacterium]|nr:ABC transporter permease [Planctomycetota bacterium]
MPEQTTLSSSEVQDQVTLPLRVAFGICLRGIRTRLGRSAITLFGVGLGIAFLMAVLSGFHIQRAMSAHAALARDADRRVAMLRGEAGALKGRAFLVLARGPSEADAAFLRALAAQGAVLDSGSKPSGCLVLGGSGPEAPMPSGVPIFAFDSQVAEAAKALAAEGQVVKHLGIELRPDEVARAQARERQARYRTAWIAGVALLITVGCIANAMLMSVTERFREIGTMKCLGALSGFVVKLFLIESLLLGLVGAALGCAVGVVVPLAAYSYTFGLVRVFAAASFAMLGLYALLCMAAGVGLAIVAAIYPARVAAKMVPASALASHV